MAATGTGAQRVRRRRDKLRVAGLRRVQIWVPDTLGEALRRSALGQARSVRDTENGSGQTSDADWFAASDTTD